MGVAIKKAYCLGSISVSLVLGHSHELAAERLGKGACLPQKVPVSNL